MTPNNNYCALPVYLGINTIVNGRPYQHHRKPYAFGKVYPLMSEKDWLLPFQFMVEGTYEPMLWAVMYSLEDEEATPVNVLPSLLAGGLSYVSRTGYYVVKYRGHVSLGLTNPPEGPHYIEMGSATKTWTTEVFTFSWGANTRCLTLEWSDVNSFEIGDREILYTESWRNRLLLPTMLGKPDYPFEEEVTKRDGYSFIEKQISEKKYRFSFLAPEYLVDAMRLIRMHDYVTIVDTEGRTYNADTFLITPTWQEQGDLASVDAEFTADTVVKKLAKATAITV